MKVHLKVAGSGNAGSNGAPAGDLYVVVHMKYSKDFTRKGDDLYTNISITFSQAAMGMEFDVPVVEGHVKVKIPSGTQPGTTLRVKEQGFPRLGTKRRGDLYVKVNIDVPKSMNDNQKKALFEYAKLWERSLRMSSIRATIFLKRYSINNKYAIISV